MRRLLALAAAAALPAASLLLLGVPTAAAEECWTEEVVTPGGIEKKRVCEDTQPGGGGDDGGGAGNGGGTGPVDTGPVTDVYYVPACSANGPPGTGSADALCGHAVNSMLCAEDEILMRVYTRLVDRGTGQPVPGADGSWQGNGTTCVGPDEEGEDPAGGHQPPQITVEMVIDSARTRVPTTTVEMDPDNQTYVRVPNNFSVESGAVSETLTVLGTAIPVTYTPTTYEWDFGDDGSATGAGIADAAVGQPGAVEHAYLRSGEYAVTVTSKWTVTFTIPGQGQVTPPGTLDSTSEPYPVQVGEVQSVVTDVG